MACAGIDFGSRRSVVAIARRGGVDICCNEVSNRATPSLVSFSGDQRFIGEAAVNYASQYPRNTVPSIQRLLGAAFDAPFTQREIQRLAANIVQTPAGGVAAEIRYGIPDADGETPSAHLSFEALAGMLFSHLLGIASAEYHAPVRDCVITVPSYYTNAQRRAVLDAAAIGNINVLRVLSEHAAVALSYGIFRTKELPESTGTPIKVAFVDMGDASTTVTIASFTNARADIISVVSDPELGGRDVDFLIADVFAKQFKETYKIDVMGSPRPRARLLKEAEKVKRVLSANLDTRLNIECLMNDVDVSGSMNREDLEKLSQPLIDRLKLCCQRAIAEAKLAPDEKLFSIEIIGAATRIPAVKAAVESQFEPLGAPLKTTLNMDECVARGAALMSAILSPAFRVRDYAINDIAQYAIDAERMPESGPSETLALIPKYQIVPCLKKMTFKSTGPVTIRLCYHDPESVPQHEKTGTISTFRIDAPVDPAAKIRAKIRLNAHGIVELAGVQLLKDVEVLEDVQHAVATVPPSSAAGIGTVPAKGTNPGTVAEDIPMPMMDDPPAAAPQDSAEADKKDNGTAVPPVVAMEDIAGPDSGVAAKQGEIPTVNSSAAATSAPPDTVVTEKRIVKKTQETDLPVSPLGGVGVNLPAKDVSSAVELEAEMKATDLRIKERSDALNGLESYVYDLRSRIEDGGDLKEFGPESVRVPLKAELDAAEDWIYSEEGDKANKSAFIKRKDDLVAKAVPMITPKRERDERPSAVTVLRTTLDSFKKLAVPSAEEYAHIDDNDKDKVLKCVEQASIWLKSELEKQEKQPLDADPVLTCAAIRAKRSEVDSVCGPIERTPKPVPKEEKPADDVAKADGEKTGSGVDASPSDGQAEPGQGNGAGEAEITVEEPSVSKEKAPKAAKPENAENPGMEWEKSAPEAGVNGS